MFYHEVEGRKHGVRVILKGEYVKSVLEVRRVSQQGDEYENKNWRGEDELFGAYAPQAG